MRVTLIMRDETGRYAWESEINYNPTPCIEPSDEDKLSTEQREPLAPEDPDDALLGTLSGFLKEAEKKIQDKVNKQQLQLIANEKKLLELRKFG